MKFSVVAAISTRAQEPAPADEALRLGEQAYAKEAETPTLRIDLGLPGYGPAWDDFSDERFASNPSFTVKGVSVLP